MIIETDQWKVTAAVKVGRDHVDRGINGQDAAAIRHDPATNTIYGIVCDGCGSGAHSEVGAKLLANYAVATLCTYGSLDIWQQKDLLFPALVRFVNNNIDTLRPPDPVAIAEIVNDFWCATIVGFIIKPHDAVIFHAGDGVYEVDSESPVLKNVKVIDQENAPHYLAYNCIPFPDQLLTDVSRIPQKFETPTNNMHPKHLQRIMISTDGFDHHDVAKIEHGRAHGVELPNGSPLPDQLFGLQWDKRGKLGLKKWMNAMWDRGYFADDCAIVTAERKDDPQSND